MNKVIIFSIISIISLSSSAKELCHEKQESISCYEAYQKEYIKKCYNDILSLESVETTINKNKKIEKSTFKINKIKKYDQKTWFSLCFYPIKYFKMICRKKVCGYYNIK